MANKTLSFFLKIDGVKSQLSDLKELEKQLAGIKVRLKTLTILECLKLQEKKKFDRCY